MAVTLDQRPLLAFTTLSANINAATTTIPCTDASAFTTPTIGYQIVIWSKTYANPAEDPNAEVLRATSKSGNNIIATRAQESTTAVTHLAGDYVAATPTPKMFDDIEDELNTNSKQKVELFWWYTDLAANQSAVSMWRGNAPATVSHYLAKRAGSITGISCSHNGTITAGTVTVAAYVAGSPVGFSTTLDSSNNDKRITQQTGVDTFAAGDKVALYISSTSGFLPDGSIDFGGDLELHLD